MAYYQRHLPHWEPDGRLLFITWRLDGSVRASVMRSLTGQPQRSARRRFKALDHYLDTSKSGPLWLVDFRVARAVVRELVLGQDERNEYDLHSFVVMANHVHVVVNPKSALAKITNRIKGHTAREANRILGRTASRFWKDESFDHWVRNESEYQRVCSYIERNPVTAGLVERASDWPWSSANPQWRRRLRRGNN